jgi:hypothetical protein
MAPASRSCCLVLVGCILFLTGCSSGPTYHKEHLAQSLHALLVDEQLEADVRFLEHTLAVQVASPDTLTQRGGQFDIGPAFDETTRKVITAIQRVLLSTDAEVRFYVLLLSDPKTPGAYFTMVRYLDDVRRANALMLNTPEIFARTVFELNFLGPQPVTIEQYVPRDIQMEEFLSWQLARRIQVSLTNELQQAGIATVGRCGGQFQQGEFAFTLDVAPPQGGVLEESTIQKAFLTSTSVIAKVLSSYQFERFDAVRLTHAGTGRSLLLPRTRLELFR